MEYLVLRRGEYANPGDPFCLQGRANINSQTPHESPRIKKSSAGYMVRAPMDLIDLLIGSEGTLGIFSEMEFRVIPKPPFMMGLLFLDSVAGAVRVANRLRDASLQTRAQCDSDGMDVRSVEYFDRRCLDLVRHESKTGNLPVAIPDDAAACLLFEQELPVGTSDDDVVEALSSASEGEEPSAARGAAVLFRLLQAEGLVESCELAMPTDARRHQQLAALREAIPLAVSDWLRDRQRIDPAVHKTAGDMIVEFPHFPTMLDAYYEAFDKAGVDVVIFGHISDGNVHPNALPKTADEVRRAKEALVHLAGLAQQLGGCPLSEHGVGKHPLKKSLMARYRGEAAVAAQQTKLAFDPH
jgi:D-lactate dehydrogenase (cytochrome)